MGLASERIDELAAEITAMDAIDRVKLMSAVMERDGTDVDWSVIAGLRSNVSREETPQLHNDINEAVREVRRARRQSD